MSTTVTVCCVFIALVNGEGRKAAAQRMERRNCYTLLHSLHTTCEVMFHYLKEDNSIFQKGINNKVKEGINIIVNNITRYE